MNQNGKNNQREILELKYTPTKRKNFLIMGAQQIWIGRRIDQVEKKMDRD